MTVARASQRQLSPAHELQRHTVAPGESALETITEGLRGRRLLMLLCCAGAPFLIMLDTNIVAVSLPSIARDLHGTFTDVEWVVSAYILPFAALLMPAGALADRLGRRRVLLIGLSIFTIASFFCGLAPNLWVLNGARALQAVSQAPAPLSGNFLLAPLHLCV